MDEISNKYGVGAPPRGGGGGGGGGGPPPASWPCRPDDRPANPTAPNTTQHPRKRLERAITANLRILSVTE